MRTHLRGLTPTLLGLAAAALLSLAARPGGAAECACGVRSCAQVPVDADNRVDFNCAPELVGQSLPDSDGDGIPDACDACQCTPNPIDEDTGRAAECPETPVTGATPATGTTAPATGTTTPPPLAALRCVNGSVQGIPEHATIWRLRPQTFAFTRFESNTSELAAGAELLVLRSLGAESCTPLIVGGKPSLRIVPSPWHWRAALFASGTVRVSKLGFDATTGLSGGIDHHRSDSIWTFGGTLHAMTLLGSADPAPLLLGLGPRLGLFDVVALTPFVQLDARSDLQPSYGVWLNFDFGVLEDLGIELERLGKLGL